jgi:hypothetical protein
MHSQAVSIREYMRIRGRQNGSVFLMVVFAIVLMATITMGIMVMSTEELQLMQNQLYAAEAMATAEAGLNDAFAQIRTNPSWTAGYTDEPFNGGTYDVNVTGTAPNPRITSEGTSSQGYKANVVADVNVGSSEPNHIIRIDKLRINE